MLLLWTTSDYRPGMLVRHVVACAGRASEPERAA
jgi:hypothetical protein